MRWLRFVPGYESWAWLTVKQIVQLRVLRVLKRALVRRKVYNARRWQMGFLNRGDNLEGGNTIPF